MPTKSFSDCLINNNNTRQISTTTTTQKSTTHQQINSTPSTATSSAASISIDTSLSQSQTNSENNNKENSQSNDQLLISTISSRARRPSSLTINTEDVNLIVINDSKNNQNNTDQNCTTPLLPTPLQQISNGGSQTVIESASSIFINNLIKRQEANFFVHQILTDLLALGVLEYSSGFENAINRTFKPKSEFVWGKLFVMASAATEEPEPAKLTQW
jgi:hypothetical protein